MPGSPASTMNYRARRAAAKAAVVLSSLAGGALGQEPSLATRNLPTATEMALARDDVWGEAALAQPGGPSYEFFRDLLPPLRYANTDFRHYPIMLSAPLGASKARWISNGSAVNARANKKPMWRELGFPVHFFVGEASEPFGDDLERLDGPRYAAGHLPIVHCTYRQRQMAYEQEAFAPVSGALAESGAVMLRFRARDAAGRVSARVGAEGALTFSAGALCDSERRSLVLAGDGWQWDEATGELRVTLDRGQAAELAVLTRPAPLPPPAWKPGLYDAQRGECVEAWQRLLQSASGFDLPEPSVQDAWQSLVVGNFLIAVGDRMHYSAGNAYDHLYEAECGDAVRSLLMFGYREHAARMIGPLLNFQRKATRFHVAGQKLQLLADYYWLTRDADLVRAAEPAWLPVAETILTERQANGLLPPDNYAGDIKQQVISLSSNSNCWRGLRDLATIMADLRDDRAADWARHAKDFRQAILDAVARSERRDLTPTFIPIALLDDEPPHDPLTATRQGSYYDLMAPYVLGSGVFAPGSQRENAMIDYLRLHGGLAMGMIRSTPHQGEFDNQPGVNVLYGWRYLRTLLRRDDRNHALVGFYGHLAQGMTRETFIGGEGSRFLHGDRFGRSFYLPPNSAANAMFLMTLRYLLIQDWDLDDDGRPETLRLLFGAPGRWLENGLACRVKDAPTAFGPISFAIESHLDNGEVIMALDAPPRPIDRWLVRLPLPPGWKVDAAELAGKKLPMDPDGTVDLTGRSGSLRLNFAVSAN